MRAKITPCSISLFVLLPAITVAQNSPSQNLAPAQTVRTGFYFRADSNNLWGQGAHFHFGPNGDVAFHPNPDPLPSNPFPVTPSTQPREDLNVFAVPPQKLVVVPVAPPSSSTAANRDRLTAFLQPSFLQPGPTADRSPARPNTIEDGQNFLGTHRLKLDGRFKPRSVKLGPFSISLSSRITPSTPAADWLLRYFRSDK